MKEDNQESSTAQTKSPARNNNDSNREEKTIGTMSRRTFALGVCGVAALLGLGGFKYLGHSPILRPPGGQDDDRVISACIRCEKCYEICPRDVIVPTHIEEGVLSMRTPTFDFSADYCDWCGDENNGDPLCVKVCPTLALELPEGATPENTILGRAALDKNTCLAYRDLGCRYCYDACPYDAMEISSTGRPSVITEKCNGCGACESVCVSLRNASISSGAAERAIVVRARELVE